ANGLGYRAPADQIATCEDAAVSGAHRPIDFDDAAAANRHAGNSVEEIDICMLPDGEHEGVGPEPLELPSADAPGSVRHHRHVLDEYFVAIELLDCRKPFDFHTLGDGLHRLVGLGFHVRLVGAVNQDRFIRAKAFGDARDIHGSAAATNHAYDAAEHRSTPLFDLLEQ